jgi:hypothetical protein
VCPVARLAKQIKDEGAALAGCKGKPEDAEMRSARRVIRARGDWEPVI